MGTIRHRRFCKKQHILNILPPTSFDHFQQQAELLWTFQILAHAETGRLPFNAIALSA